VTPELSMAEKPDVFTATCPGGLEALLAEEIASFGGKITRTGPGAVYLEGNRETAYRICLWSRFAHRVLKPLGACSARDENELYRAASSIDWPAHFSPEKTIAVVCKATRSPILNTHYAALRIKDAVADLFTKRFGVRPDVDTGNPDITIHAYLEQDKASFSIDLAGEGLHRRGYRLARSGSDKGNPGRRRRAPFGLALPGCSKTSAPDRPHVRLGHPVDRGRADGPRHRAGAR